MYMYIIMFETSDEFSEQLDQGKTKCNKEDCMLSTLMKQSLMFKYVNNINHQVIVIKIIFLICIIFFSRLQTNFENFFIII